MKYHQELFGRLKILEPPALAAIDSDTEHNEIIKWIQFINDDGKSFIFPGFISEFSNHKGGCDFNIVSEHIARNWHDIHPQIVDPEGADIIAVAFSLGGGTGSGAGPIVAYKSKQRVERFAKASQKHFMGIGVLPESDSIYFNDEFPGGMVDGEKYNVGRFLVNLYSQLQTKKAESRLDSLWLFSNDIKRVIMQKSEEDIEELSLSLINKYIAASLLVLGNASSEFTKSEPNFDPMEMNNRLGGNPFISGYASTKPTVGGDAEIHTRTIQVLFKKALNNPSIIGSRSDSERLNGLSVPVKEEDLNSVNAIFEAEGYSELMIALKNYQIESSPVEFRTAPRIVVLYGHNANSFVAWKVDLARKMASTIFSNSILDFYRYEYAGQNDSILILIINPLIRFVLSAVYYYTNVSWVKDEFTLGQSDSVFDNLIRGDQFRSEDLTRLLLDEEKIDMKYHGKATIEVLESEQYRSLQKLQQTSIVETFNHLHDIYHHRKPGGHGPGEF